jgi:hypothetical protein
MDIREYFMKNYKIIIPTSSPIDFICENDITYGEWLKDLSYHATYLKSKLDVKELYEHKLYMVEYEILWAVHELPYLETEKCYGAKCRREQFRSFERWCVDCYGHQYDEKISKMVEIYIKGEDNYDNITVRDILPYIYDVRIISIKHISN